MSAKTPHRPLKPLPSLIFASRWLQLPLYLGLIVAQMVYVVNFVVEVWHLVANTLSYTESQIMLAVLGLIDVVMISNLLIMVIVGGYETFIAKLGLDDHPDEPEWLDHVNAGVLKVKLSMALISISSIHLLKSFIDAEHKSSEAMFWQVMIHLAFLVSALVMAQVERMTGHGPAPAPAPAPSDH